MNNSIRVNCTKKNLKLIRDFVTEYLHALALTDILMNQIVLAVDEICANLIIHANHEDPDKYILLAIYKQPGMIKFEISDEGIAFQRAAYKEPNIQENIRLGKKGGVGIALVNRIMDKVEFKTEGPQNTCILYKKI
ncbi:serine/threonine-protein kinase RsbW [Pontibacter ummariensis]|uniref:Serine/threonine-protein kinase RsbW n=1 Tax=Pontibacter ummariensis TaxID=1610492 RepID=A0A239B446_9BACT|nr:ATP-binding protein [Pontibacter ummariensis]PRY16273.1 serine/threonine-protein kinase RsbW [Pontibacter ummariensis]SNS02302.1 serine/threonine-protein kinase RsbW [Pontibacter ummariensis]